MKPWQELARLARPLRCESGQGMVEYALLTSLVGMILLVPWPGFPKPVLTMFVDAIQRYMDYWFYCLNAPF